MAACAPQSMPRILLALALFLTACPPLPPPVPPPGAATCQDFCTHLQKLGCEAAKPTPEGATCETVCLNIQNSGVIRWNLGCRTAALTCADIDKCEP